MKELGLDVNNYKFQTKDLNSFMDHYYIQGGKLFLEKYKSEEWVKGDESSKDLFGKLGYMNKKEPYMEQVSYHGEIYFYEYVQSIRDKWDCWIEFKAVFSNGAVDKYELVKFTKTDNADRLKKEQEFQDQIKKTTNKLSNRYFFNTKPVRWFNRKVWYRTWHRLGEFCYSMSLKGF